MTEETKSDEKNDTFLESVANELNKNCEFREVESNEDAYGYIFPKWIKWTPNKLSYDYTEIEKYCLEFVPHSARTILTKDHEFCDSCKSILEERIRKPYNKTNFDYPIKSLIIVFTSENQIRISKLVNISIPISDLVNFSRIYGFNFVFIS